MDELLLDNITYHEDLLNDINKIIGRSGQKKRFMQVFLARLQEINNNDVADLLKSKNYEVLRHCKDFTCFSARIKSNQLNCRLLFKIENQKIILCCFDKKSDSEQTNYSPAIDRAKNRLNELRESHYKLKMFFKLIGR